MGGWTIAWTNAALSAGALAIVVPYLIHLITKRTPRTMVFPTIQFLKRAQASQSRLFRLRNLMLLLVRTAFIALLLLAFLKPVLRATAMAEDGERTQAAIIIIDASLSMKYNANGITPYQRAQRAVSDLLDLLGSGTPKNLIIAGGVPLPSLESPSTNGAPLVRDLLSTAPIDMRADIDAAIDEAVRQLEQYSDHDRTIYFVSDFQRTNWAAAQFDAIPEDIKFVFSPVGEQDASNLAVTEVMLRPKSPVVTEIVEIVCTVANYGPAPVELPVSLTLEPIGDRPTRSAEETDTLHRTLSLASGSTGSVSFRLRATDTGAFEGRVQIPDDLLNADNQRYFVFEVQDQ
ncbi:MAG TPA: BatA domain-containing protein, partial [Candidatus Hydrogenedentes bacterium]|nr:BatA domain-containing protein [Candidatus Hydrogenedentota bacterium]